MASEKGATYLDKLCHKFYGEPKGHGEKTDYVCRLCGGPLETYYCEERLYLVRCVDCGTLALVKTTSPQAAAGVTLARPTLTPPNEWVSVEERLPEDSEFWRTYIVTVNRSHWPTSSYDICDAPYDEQLVASAQYDSKQKIWHLPWDEQLNALIQADDAPLNGDFVTHWMLLPAPPDSRPPEGEEDT